MCFEKLLSNSNILFSVFYLRNLQAALLSELESEKTVCFLSRQPGPCSTGLSSGCHDKVQQIRWLKHVGIYFSQSLKPEIRVPAGSGWSETSLPGLQHRLLTMSSRGGERVSSLVPLLVRTPTLSGQGSTHDLIQP